VSAVRISDIPVVPLLLWAACAYPNSLGNEGSAHTPFFASLASFSSTSNTVSLGAYFLHHQHQPSLTNVWLTFVPSDRSILNIDQL